MAKATTTTQPTADDKARRVIAILAELKAALADLDPGQDRIFGEGLLQAAIQQAEQRKGFYPELYGLPARPTPQEALIISAELNLENQKRLLKEIESKRGRVFSLKQPRPIEPAQREIDAAHQRVEDARQQLERAKGNLENYLAEQKARKLAEQQAERQEQAAGIAAWQERARAAAEAT